MLFDKIKAYGFQALALVLVVLLLTQTWRLHTEQLARRTLVAEVEAQRAKAAIAYAGAVTKNSEKQSAHAESTQGAVHEFNQSKPPRDDALRSELGRSERLRIDADRRAATYRAQAQANEAACRGLADRLETFDRHIVEGVAVVAGLRADLGRRDAEVVLLRRQIDADRALQAE